MKKNPGGGGVVLKLLKKVDGVIYLHFILYSERKFIAHRCCQDLSLTSFRSMKTAINESISPCLVGFKMRFDEFNFTLRIMGSQNWWFGDPRTLLYRFRPFYKRVHDS